MITAERLQLKGTPTVDASESSRFALVALMEDLAPHVELDLRTLGYHLQQSDATAADGYHHAAINEARSFLEALVVSIVHASRGKKAGGDAGSSKCTAFGTYRRRLMDSGFIDVDENELLHFVYGIASAKGSHHGIADEAWAGVARRIVFVAGQYLVQRYGEWKRNGRPCAVIDTTRNGRRRGWIARLLGKG